MANTPSGDGQEIDLAKRRKSRLSFIALVAIAALPVLGAYAMYFFMPDMAPADRSNEGQLITPPFPLSELGGDAASLEGKWTLLLPLEGDTCDAGCERMLYVARQVNVALGKESTRVQRSLLQSSPRLSARFLNLVGTEYPNMKRRVLPAEAFTRLAEAAGTPQVDGHIFVADPIGNVMMVYTKEQEGGALIDDLKKLLRLSNIG